MENAYLVSKNDLKGKVMLIVPLGIPVPEGCPKLPYIRGTAVTVKKDVYESLKQEYKNKNLDIEDYIIYKGCCQA